MPPDELAGELATKRSEAYFAEAVERGVVLLAETGGRVAGYIQLSELAGAMSHVSRVPGDLAIHALYVHPDFQRRGIGRALVEAALAHLRLSGVDRVFLDVWEKNARALNFYLSHGFRPVGRCDAIVNGKKVGEDLVMEKALR